MFINHLKTALRNLKKHKGFSFINIFGLALGMSVCLFIIKFVVFFHSFDRFHENSDRIFQVITSRTTAEGVTDGFAGIPAPFFQALERECPGIELAVPVSGTFTRTVVEKEKNRVFSTEYIYTSPEFFNLFNFKIISGTEDSPLSRPFTVLLTQTLADLFFPGEDPLGKVLSFNELGELTVTGILEDFPKNTLFMECEALVSYETLVLRQRQNNTGFLENWTNLYNFLGFIRLEKPISQERIEETLNAILPHHFESEELTYRFYLEHLDDLPLRPELKGIMGIQFPPIILTIFSLAGLSVLLIAAFNYTNLTAAKSLSRLKEIGVRKVIGAERRHIFLQFLGESVLMSILALGAAVFFAQIVEFLFFRLHSELLLYFDFKNGIWIYGVFLVFALLTGLLAGFLPAFSLSKFRPVRVLHFGMEFKLFSKLTIRKLMIVGQISLSLLFLLTTLITYDWSRHYQNLELGFDKNYVVFINSRMFLNEDYHIFKDELKQSPYIEGVTASGSLPGTSLGWSVNVRKEAGGEDLGIFYFPIDENFLPQYRIALVAGENFTSSAAQGVENKIMINRTAALFLGYESPTAALGQTLIIEPGIHVQIIGVVDDFIHDDIYESIKPLMLRFLPEQYYYSSIKISSTNIPEALAYIERSWKKLYPYEPLTYEFLTDKIIDEGLQAFILPAKIGGFISILAIFISSLGLLGMVMYTTRAKIKEIGIRKVFGAGLLSLVRLLSRGYLVLIIVAGLLTAPLVLFLNLFILQHMSNHGGANPAVYLVGILLMLAVGLIPILFQTVRAALLNPAACLKYE